MSVIYVLEFAQCINVFAKLCNTYKLEYYMGKKVSENVTCVNFMLTHKVPITTAADDILNFI